MRVARFWSMQNASWTALEMVESVQRLKRGEASALNVGYATNLFYDSLPTTLASSDNCSLPLRSIFSTCHTVISFARSRRHNRSRLRRITRAYPKTRPAISDDCVL